MLSATLFSAEPKRYDEVYGFLRLKEATMYSTDAAHLENSQLFFLFCLKSLLFVICSHLNQSLSALFIFGLLILFFSSTIENEYVISSNLKVYFTSGKILKILPHYLCRVTTTIKLAHKERKLQQADFQA